MDTIQPIQAQFSLTYAERLKANMAVTRDSIPTLIWLSFFPLCGLTLLALNLLNRAAVPLVDGFLIAACFGFVPFMFLFNTYRAHKAQLKKGPHFYQFDSSGLQAADKTSELKQRWEAISRAREKSGFLLLYFSKACAHCVPIRAFSNPEQVQAVLRLASEGGVPRVGT